MARIAAERGLALERSRGGGRARPGGAGGERGGAGLRAAGRRRSPASRATAPPGRASRPAARRSGWCSRTTCSSATWGCSTRMAAGAEGIDTREAQRASAGDAGACRAGGAGRRPGAAPARRRARSDSSAYLISRRVRGAGARDASRATAQPLDLALFDPATGAAVAQLDPALTIQQRYADFRFLDEGAGKTDIQAPRAAAQGPGEAVARELASGSGAGGSCRRCSRR